MEKRKWLSFNSSPGGSDSSDSASSPERDSYQQEVLKGPPSSSDLSVEFASVAVIQENDMNETVRTLTEKLSAALINIGAKEDLVKQHSKVAEEAVAGWEKAEIELTIIKEKLESAVQQKIILEDRVSHLDGALKECVRQLRLAREEQEKNILEAIAENTKEWESTKREFQSRILELEKRSSPSVEPNFADRLEALEKENFAFKFELQHVSEELEIRTIERDLSTETAEAASKQTLESIKRIAKLESECRRLRNAASKVTQGSGAKSASASSVYVDSLTDSQSDGTERLTLEEMDICKVNSSELNGKVLNQSRNDRVIGNNSAVRIDLMDDFLEMERLAALPDLEKESGENESMLKANIDALNNCRVELEEKLEKLDKENRELLDALRESREAVEVSRAQLIETETKMGDLQKELDISSEMKHSLEKLVAKSQKAIEASQLQLREAMMRMEQLRMELDVANEAKQALESLVVKSKVSEGTVEALHVKLMDAESRLLELQEELIQANEAKQLLTSQLAELEARSAEMDAEVLSLEEEVAKERALSKENAMKYHILKEELGKKEEELFLLQNDTSTQKIKMKQEQVDEAAGKLAECQKTIVSLRKLLESLATLEDFLIDTTGIPEFPAAGAMVASANGELWKLHSNHTFIPKRGVDTMQDNRNSPVSSSLSATSTAAPASQATSAESNRTGFAKFFSRTKNGIQLEI